MKKSHATLDSGMNFPAALDSRFGSWSTTEGRLGAQRNDGMRGEQLSGEGRVTTEPNRTRSSRSLGRMVDVREIIPFYGHTIHLNSGE